MYENGRGYFDLGTWEALTGLRMHFGDGVLASSASHLMGMSVGINGDRLIYIVYTHYNPNIVGHNGEL
jgi:hypothetical protein